MVKKKFFTLFLCTIITILLSTSLYLVIVNLSYDAVRTYLCDKYDIKKDSIILMYHKSVSDNKEKVTTYKFIYKNKIFNVIDKNNSYVDDFQFDNIEKWCTEYLQINVDNRIIGIQLDTDMIGAYNRALTQDDVLKFLQSQGESISLIVAFNTNIGYYEIDLNDYGEITLITNSVKDNYYRKFNIKPEVMLFTKSPIFESTFDKSKSILKYDLK